MKLLYIPDYDDYPYVQRLNELLGDNYAALAKSTPTMVAQIRSWAQQCSADAIIVSNNGALDLILNAMADYVPSARRRKISCVTYAGSLLHLVVGDRKIPVIVILPLRRMVSTKTGKFLNKRYISKVLHEDRWPAEPEFRYTLVTPANAQEVIARCAAARLLATDIETPWPQHEMRVISCVGYGAWFPDTNTVECFVVPFKDEFAWSVVSQINSNPVPKVTQNGLFDNHYFMRWGLPLHNWIWDTFHLFHCWYSELPKRLDFIAGFTIRNVRYWKDDGAGSEEALYRYNARDCWATITSLLGILREMPSYAARNYLQEFPLVFPCLTCNLEGVAVDETEFAAAREKLLADHAVRLERLRTMVAWPSYNPNSPKQTLEVLKMLGLGHITSTDKIAMQRARATGPLADRILGELVAFKKTAKLLSTYMVPEKLWNKRIMYSLNPGKTDTGRLACDASSFDCGLQIQNIPGGPVVKRAIIAEEGWQFGEADGEQAEARCVGYQSGETKLIDLVESPHDYHSWNASAFFGIPYEEIYDELTKKKLMPEIRDLSKRTNHGANYNMGADVMLDTMGPLNVIKARRLLGLPESMPLRSVCQYLLDQYSKTYPGIKGDYYAWIVRCIVTTKVLVSPLGWTRYFFGEPHKNKLDLNAAVAHPSQNLSVAIINKGFYAVWHSMIYGKLRNRIRLKAQIHDSIFFLFRIGDVAAAEEVVKLSTVPTPVTDVHGVTRTLVIPMAISYGKPEEGKPALRWSDCK